MQRVRIIFAKTDHMRYIGHLDLYRAWERMLRRAGLPLAYTQGFSPHPRINLASALPLGVTGAEEMVDIWLDRDIDLEQATAMLRKSAPPGLEIKRLAPVTEGALPLQTELQASEFILTLLEPVPDLESRRRAVLAAPSLPRLRRGKAYDLRPLLVSLESLPADEAGHQRLLAQLVARENATGRPDELLAEMGIDPLAARLHRLRLLFL